MKWEAKVRRVTGITQHRIATVVDGRLVPQEVLPSPSTVRIEDSGGDRGVFLFLLNAAGECIADEWALTVEEAKRQARYEFAIEEEDWAVVPDDSEQVGKGGQSK